MLSAILANKRDEVARRKRACPLSHLRECADEQPAARGFVKALRGKIASGAPAVVAEIKRASPSAGILRERFDPSAIAREYAWSGAACLSVLTDERFFRGRDADLRAAVDAVPLPVLRKDFTIDEYQIVEARVLGADCVLLIVAATDAPRLKALADIADDLGLDVLVEVRDRAELDTALALNPRLVGVNNRDLDTFKTRLETTLDLIDAIPDSVLTISENGIRSPSDVRALRERGVNAFLVGEALMRASNVSDAIRSLFFR